MDYEGWRVVPDIRCAFEQSDSPTSITASPLAASLTGLVFAGAACRDPTCGLASVNQRAVLGTDGAPISIG